MEKIFTIGLNAILMARKQSERLFIRMNASRWILPVIFPLIPLLQLNAQITPGEDGNIYVKQSGTGNGSSWASATGDLQGAIDAALFWNENRTVWVAAGTYKPTTGTNRSISFTMKDGVAIYGGFPATGNPTLAHRDWKVNVTILSGDIGNVDDSTDNSFHVLYSVMEDSTSILDGFSIIKGNANGTLDDSSFADRGAGMYNVESSPTVSNCVFSNNSTIGGGGGMYNGGGSPKIENCEFSLNTAGLWGGGIFNTGASPVLTDCKFLNNTSAQNGGGMYNSYTSTPVMINCIFKGNKALNKNSSKWAAGGGIYNVESSPVLWGCSFSDNRANDDGAAISNDSSSPQLTNCRFSGNIAGLNGDGMYNYNSSSPSLTNCSFYNNKQGVGYEIVNSDSSSPRFTNCTFSGEESYFVTGMRNISKSSAVLVNCIISGFANQVFNGVGSNASITYSLVEGGYEGIGNIEGDPLFVDVANGDLRLQAGSNANDKGTSNGAPSFDQDGKPRPIGTGFDMGAYEFGEPAVCESFISDTTLTIYCNTDSVNLNLLYETESFSDFEWNTPNSELVGLGAYRLIAETHNGACKDTAYVTISQHIATWKGAVNSNWNNISNWKDGIKPGALSHVIIPSGTPNSPEITTLISILSLQVKPGAEIKILPGGNIITTAECLDLPLGN